MWVLQIIDFVRPHFRKIDFSHSLALEPTAPMAARGSSTSLMARRLTASVGLLVAYIQHASSSGYGTACCNNEKESQHATLPVGCRPHRRSAGVCRRWRVNQR